MPSFLDSRVWSTGLPRYFIYPRNYRHSFLGRQRRRSSFFRVCCAPVDVCFTGRSLSHRATGQIVLVVGICPTCCTSPGSTTDLDTWSIMNQPIEDSDEFSILPSLVKAQSHIGWALLIQAQGFTLYLPPTRHVTRVTKPFEITPWAVLSKASAPPSKSEIEGINSHSSLTGDDPTCTSSVGRTIS